MSKFSGGIGPNVRMLCPPAAATSDGRVLTFKLAQTREFLFTAKRGKPNTRVTSRKVGTVSFVSIADEGRSCGTKTPERARKSKSPGAGVSFGLIKPAQPATLKITEEEVDTVRVELVSDTILLSVNDKLVQMAICPTPWPPARFREVS
jgi:hypothetical protein